MAVVLVVPRRQGEGGMQTQVHITQTMMMTTLSVQALSPDPTEVDFILTAQVNIGKDLFNQ